MPQSRGAIWCLLLSLAAGGCERGPAASPAPSDSPRQLTLALNWFPEAEHGGFYAAKVHGFFADEGLQVSIRSGGPGAPVIQQLATGRVDFAVANADQVLLGRDQQAPVVAVMAPLQDSPRCIMVHEHSGIRQLLDLRNLTLAVGSGKPFAKFLLNRLSADAQLTIVPYQGSVSMFLQREDFAQQGYLFSEPYLARQHGAEPRCLMLSEIGFNPYTSLLVVNERRIAEDPQLVERMVRACQRGWQQYLEAPEATNAYIHEQNAEMSPEILQFGAAAIRPLCLPNDLHPGSIGQMSAQRWETLAGQLAEIDLLDDTQVWQHAYDDRFLGRPAGHKVE